MIRVKEGNDVPVKIKPPRRVEAWVLSRFDGDRLVDSEYPTRERRDREARRLKKVSPGSSVYLTLRFRR